MTTELPGKALARELIEQSREAARHTPIDPIIEAARERRLDDGAAFRLICRLWAMERLFYYIYGGWGQGLELNDYPPSVKYLFARQIMDESTHEMLYMDTMLGKGWLDKQRDAFDHPCGRFAINCSLSSYAYSLRYFASYPHSVRIAALNLGPKIVELAWMEQLADALDDAALKGVFTSQFVENRSHINMGRRIVEEQVSTPFDTELCRRVCAAARKDYAKFLTELANLVLQRETGADTGQVRGLFQRVIE
ncbi:MAG TPA: hypothetical protein VMV15_09215 [Candidatus Binataceae bacterium]|nr:hypothetical protein [Candidatus Binataceae bacterium]